MSDTVFEVGNKISLQLIKKGGLFTTKESDKTAYSSQILKIISPKEITISIPIYKSAYISVNHDDIYKVLFHTKSGIYHCRCIVTQMGTDNKLRTCNVRFISNVERFQRREFYRLEFRTYITYAKLDDYQEKLYNDLKFAATEGRRKLINEQIKAEEIAFFNGLMIDISGGGMKFHSGNQLQKDDTVYLVPNIPELSKDIPFFIGKIIGSRQLGSDITTYENKVKFINISSTEREKIITYIFAAERSKMRND